MYCIHAFFIFLFRCLCFLLIEVTIMVLLSYVVGFAFSHINPTYRYGYIHTLHIGDRHGLFAFLSSLLLLKTTYCSCGFHF